MGWGGPLPSSRSLSRGSLGSDDSAHLLSTTAAIQSLAQKGSLTTGLFGGLTSKTKIKMPFLFNSLTEHLLVNVQTLIALERVVACVNSSSSLNKPVGGWPVLASHWPQTRSGRLLQLVKVRGSFASCLAHFPGIVPRSTGLWGQQGFLFSCGLKTCFIV